MAGKYFAKWGKQGSKDKCFWGVGMRVLVNVRRDKETRRVSEVGRGFWGGKYGKLGSTWDVEVEGVRMRRYREMGQGDGGGENQSKVSYIRNCHKETCYVACELKNKLKH